MAERLELKKEYLLQMRNELKVAKKKFFKVYKFYREGTILCHPFLEEFAIPLNNIVEKIQAFKEFFAALKVKYPRIPDVEELFDRRVEFWYRYHPKVEQFIHNGEQIDIKYNCYTDTLNEYWHEYIW